MGTFAAATLFAWVTPILPQLLSPESEIPMTPQEASWMISVPEFSNVVTPIPAGILANHFGRKPVILLIAPLIALNWAIVLYFKTYSSLMVGRSLHGAAVGIVYTTIPVYLGEIASKEYRGAISSLFFIFSWSGYLFEYIFGSFLSFSTLTLLTLIVPIVFLILFSFQPESPHFLIMKNRKEDALKSLRWFRPLSDVQLSQEFEEMIASADKNRGVSDSWMSVVKTPTDRKALFLLLFVNAVRVLSGTLSIVSYATENFEISRNLTVAPKYITILLGVVLVLGACFSFFTVDVFGRRTLLISSCLGSCVSLFVAGGYYYLDSNTSVDVAHFSWVAPTAIMVYAGVVVAGLYPVCTAYTSELFTSETRTTAASLCSVLATSLTFVILKCYQNFEDVFGVYFNFFWFASICLVGAVVSYLVMPETKNKTFEQIRREL